MKIKLLIRVVVFAVLFFVGLHIDTDLLIDPLPTDVDSYKNIAKFYDEPKGTLDAIYTGSSTAYMYWAAPLAWNEYGIAVYPLSSGGLPFYADRILIEEARKTQPDALYIISLTANRMASRGDVVAAHYVIDNMPWSVNKLRLIDLFCDEMGTSMADRLEFVFPIIRYHSRWSKLNESDFRLKQIIKESPKGADVYGPMLTAQTDQSSLFVTTDKREPLSELTQKHVSDLLDYCDREDLNVLFVIGNTPSGTEEAMGQLNTVADMCREHGYPVLDLKGQNEEIGIDETRDYIDPSHPNVHGMTKTTDYLARYLADNYGFEDKRGDPAYSSWDEAYADYLNVISPYALDFEYTDALRDFDLGVPVLSGLSADESAIILSWASVPDATGYQVYRKANGGSWSPIAAVGADELSYRDASITEAGNYTYTVASYKTVNGETYWGDYDYRGVNVEVKEG